MRASILFLFTIHFIYASYAIQCGQSQCPSGNACCNDYATGYRCYDPKTYHCVANDMNQTVLCASKQQACGTACYNPASFDCTDGEVLCGVSSAGQMIKSCAGQCYNPSKFGCCKGKLVGLGASTACSPVPANDTTLFCSPFSQVACTPGQSCCDGSCYDTTAQVCFDNQLCPLGSKVCGTTCYDTKTQECCNKKIYASGKSVCSTAKATCCSCSCKSTVISGFSSTFTVPAPAQCTATYIKSNFGSQLDCPATTYKSCTSDTNECASSINCGSSSVFIERCYGYNNSCSGTYLCGGGSYSCSIQSRSSCPAPTSNQYESGHNVTLTSSGSTAYEYVPPAYAGKVCCWCSTSSEPVATSTPVPSYNDCNVAYVAANDYFNYPNATCRVWSRDLFETPQRLVCGLPSE